VIADPAWSQVEPLTRQHILDEFDCGRHESLNNWLKKFALASRLLAVVRFCDRRVAFNSILSRCAAGRAVRLACFLSVHRARSTPATAEDLCSSSSDRITHADTLDALECEAPTHPMANRGRIPAIVYQASQNKEWELSRSGSGECKRYPETDRTKPKRSCGWVDASIDADGLY